LTFKVSTPTLSAGTFLPFGLDSKTFLPVGVSVHFGATGFKPFWLNAARTDCRALIVTAQGLVSEQPPPDQPVKVEPGAAFAVNVTSLRYAKECEQVEPQLIPAGSLLTEPPPLPAFATVSGAGGRPGSPR
jgi:hypothetical protein